MTNTPDPSRPLKNVAEAGKTRQKQPDTRTSLACESGVLNEHPGAAFNDVSPAQVPLQPPANRCPICGEPNQCSLSNPATATHACWCFTTEIAPEARERIPADAQNKACICPGCARGELPEKP